MILFAILITGCGKKLTSVQTGKDSEPLVQTESTNNVEVSDKGEISTSMDDSNIINDTEGQWAIDAEASSSYAGITKGVKNDKWSPAQLIGRPDVELYGEDPKAWAAETKNGKSEWIKLKYQTPVNATEVRIRENYDPGAIAKVELLDTSGKSHIIWEGTDTTTKGNQVRYFIVRFKRTTYKTNEIKITLSQETAAGWAEIDAVQLIGK
jgi:hypothetical protein